MSTVTCFLLHAVPFERGQLMNMLACSLSLAPSILLLLHPSPHSNYSKWQTRTQIQLGCIGEITMRSVHRKRDVLFPDGVSNISALQRLRAIACPTSSFSRPPHFLSFPDAGRGFGLQYYVLGHACRGKIRQPMYLVDQEPEKV